MTYKISNTRQQEQTLFTEVEYNFDGQIIITEVAHFSPQSTEEIEQNIINRAQSELQKLTVVSNISNLISSIEIDTVKTII